MNEIIKKMYEGKDKRNNKKIYENKKNTQIRWTVLFYFFWMFEERHLSDFLWSKTSNLFVAYSE